MSAEEFDIADINALLYSSFNKETKAVNAKLFLEAIEIVPHIFTSLGSALSAGNSALTDKVGIVRANLKETATLLSVDEDVVSLQDIIQRDIEKKWTHTGKKARHATRNIIRLVWFLDFVVALFTKIIDDSIKTTKEIIQQCWNETLGPRQRRMVNFATKQALKLMSPPSHEKLFTDFKLNDLSKEERSKLFTLWAENIGSVAENLWEFFKANKIEKVP